MTCAKPIIFLDIDGVICTRRAAGWSREGRPLVRRLVKSLARRPVRAIDQAAMAHLNTLCHQTGADVVVSSMWRIDRDVPHVLGECGFRGQFHHDWRTDADGPTRGDEITRWLIEHGYQSYLVIDDKGDELQAHQDRLILTENYSGMSEADVARGVLLLTPVRMPAQCSEG